MSPIAALDIGGTHVSSARVDLRSAQAGQLVRVEYEPNADRSALLEAILDAASSATADDVEAIGVSAPGPFDYANGVCTITGLGKLEALYGTNLRSELARACGVKPAAVVFLNDAEAFLLGEAAYGAANGHSRAIGLTLGTGLGSAFLVDAAIVREGAGVPPDGSLHLLSFRGAPVEDRISARGLQARLAGERRDVRELAHAARAGDGNARRAFTTFSAELAEFLEPCVLAFAPTCVVVGGSIARAWDLLAAGLETAFPRVQVTAAERIDESALLGAALHASRGRGSLPVAGQRGSGPGADHRDRRRTPS